MKRYSDDVYYSDINLEVYKEKINKMLIVEPRSQKIYRLALALYMIENEDIYPAIILKYDIPIPEMVKLFKENLKKINYFVKLRNERILKEYYKVLENREKEKQRLLCESTSKYRENYKEFKTKVLDKLKAELKVELNYLTYSMHYYTLYRVNKFHSLLTKARKGKGLDNKFANPIKRLLTKEQLNDYLKRFLLEASKRYQLGTESKPYKSCAFRIINSYMAKKIHLDIYNGYKYK